MEKTGLYAGLMKIPLSLMISLSATFGFIMHKNILDRSLLLTAAAVLSLACGGACLNNYQDRHIDRLFSRTRHRALPSGKLRPVRALILSTVLILSGITTLYHIHYNFRLPLLGIGAIILYNGIYTRLKTRTSLAIIPGALCGMMPPLMGWAAAGGELFALKIVSIMALFGLWQLPHFWLILLNYGSEYNPSVMPTILQWFTRFQLEKIVFIWIVNFAAMLLFVPILYWENNNTTRWIFVTAAIVLIAVAFFKIFLRPFQDDYLLLFHFLNGSVFFIMIVAICGRLI